MIRRDTIEMLEIRMKHGLEGYAIANMMIEKIGETRGAAVIRDYDALGYEFHTDPALIKKVVEDSQLFKIVVNPDNKKQFITNPAI